MRRILTLLTALGAFLMMAIVTPRAFGEEQQGKKVDSNDEISLEDLLKARILRVVDHRGDDSREFLGGHCGRSKDD